MKRKSVIVFISLALSAWTYAQSWSNDWFGVQAGIYLQVGTAVNAIGIQTKAYAGTSWGQLNVGNTVSFNLTHLGNRKKFWENRTYLGGALSFGKQVLRPDFELDGLNHQSKRQFGVAYNYLLYWDNANTSQRSGGFGLHLDQFSIRMENDVFAGQARDRFRTGHVQIAYRYEQFKFAIGGYIWTGETRGAPWNKIAGNKMPNGYRDLSEMPFGKTAHGILYLSGSYNMGYGNQIFTRIGWDSEQIRHGIQNRAFHDLAGMPKKWKRSTPHYPRLDQDGCPIFSSAERKKDRFYFQAGANDNWGN